MINVKINDSFLFFINLNNLIFVLRGYSYELNEK